MATKDNVVESGKLEFLRRAAEAYERMMKEDQEQMITFDQMDERALEVGRELERWLLERRLEEAVKRKATKPVACPKCGKALDLGPPRERRVQGQVGQVSFGRPVTYCASCRKHFSPCGRATAAECGGL